ncbi:phosphatase PAP2 family protein [Actinoplanes sp. NPDC051346]|uniref:phosphatase PAP2 family protein n=1 Tax=Actinoplanes sp. NPDC051346 TaxID=3155048 RepID=UPI0034154701
MRRGPKLKLAGAGTAIGTFAVITALAPSESGLTADLTTRDWLAHAGPSWLATAARTATYVGQGGPLTLATLALAAFLTWRRKTCKPAILFLATFILVMVVVGLPKVYFRRGAPADPETDAVRFFSKSFCGGPECQSYPSGHAANAVAWYGLAMLLLASAVTLAARWLIQGAAATVTAVATILSGYHWLTDTVAGLALGVAIYLVLSVVNGADPRYVTWLDERLVRVLTRGGRQRGDPPEGAGRPMPVRAEAA